MSEDVGSFPGNVAYTLISIDCLHIFKGRRLYYTAFRIERQDSTTQINKKGHFVTPICSF